MEASRTLIDWSEQLVVAETGEHDTLQLRAQGELLLNKRAARRTWWMRAIAAQQAAGLPLYLVYDPMDRSLLEIFLPMPHRIEYVAPESQEDRLAVGLLAVETSVFLHLNHNEFVRIRSLLAASVSQPDEVLVTINSENREILDARHLSVT